MMSCRGSAAWKDILDQMSARITIEGDADIWVMCATAAIRTEALQYMAAAGADPDRIVPFIISTDSIWIRDYGPLFVCEGGVRVMVDHTYDRPRPNDNLLPIVGYNADALATWATAMPDRQVIPIPSQGIVSAAGVLHCITKHVPVSTGGVAPVAWLRTLRGGESLTPGEDVEIAWAADDDMAVVATELRLSLDDGATWPIEIATALPGGMRSWMWTVPGIPTSSARIRVVVSDAGGHSGADQSDASITIGAPGVPGDLDGDGEVGLSDLLIVLAAWGGCTACDACPADLTGDCQVDFADLVALLALWE